MNRKIKFRGKDLCKKRWIYGSLIQKFGIKPQIVCKMEYNGQISYSECFVERDSVGQFTGLKDKNGREIYEGDIVKCKSFIYQVCYECERIASFYMVSYGDMYRHYFGEAMEAEDCVVIGNIYDNPELLKIEEVTTLRRRGENG